MRRHRLDPPIRFYFSKELEERDKATLITYIEDHGFEVRYGFLLSTGEEYNSGTRHAEHKEQFRRKLYLHRMTRIQNALIRRNKRKAANRYKERALM